MAASVLLSQRSRRLLQSALIGILSFQSLWVVTQHAAYASETILFTPPPDAPAPTRSTEGASRSYNDEISRFRASLNHLTQDIFIPPQNTPPLPGIYGKNWCLNNSHKPINSLMPKNQYGLTFSGRPTISMEMPDTHIQQIYLRIETETGDVHSADFLPVPEQREQGVVQFQLPQTAPELAPNQNYRWTLAAVCGENIRPDAPTFEGWIMRTERSPEADQVLAAAPSVEQVAWLGERGYWYDMIAIILENPNFLEN